MECAWGQVVVVRADNSTACLKERDLGAKLEALYAKSLYPVALGLAADEEVAPALFQCSRKLQAGPAVHMGAHCQGRGTLVNGTSAWAQRHRWPLAAAVRALQSGVLRSQARPQASRHAPEHDSNLCILRRHAGGAVGGRGHPAPLRGPPVREA